MKRIAIEILLCIAILACICLLILQNGKMLFKTAEASVTESPHYIPGMTAQQMADQDVMHIVTYDEIMANQQEEETKP